MPGTEMDRYAHLDIEGKVVVVEGANPHGSGSSSVSGDPHHKATIAAGRGAAAVIILLEEGSWLPAPEMEERPSVRIPALAISGEMAEAVGESIETGADWLIMSAAVADFAPAEIAGGKLKKEDLGTGWSLEMRRNPDILGEIVPAHRGSGLKVVGFALETADMVFLTAGDDDVARVYERVGFARLATTGVAEWRDDD